MRHISPNIKAVSKNKIEQYSKINHSILGDIFKFNADFSKYNEFSEAMN